MYKFMYKCRHCGENFTPSDRIFNNAEDIRKFKLLSDQDVNISTHQCYRKNPNIFGIGDIIRIERVGDGENGRFNA